MKKIVDIFRIRRGERWIALVSFVVFTLLNALTVWKYWEVFSQLSHDYRKLFVSKFHISGFDPLTYQVISDWDTAYNVYRHPLLAFFLWPVSMLNAGLQHITGINFATPLTACIIVFCAFYASIFLFRIMYEVIGVKLKMAYCLVAMTFSFAFVMLSAMVPDHFIMSMFALVLTVYLGGMKLKRGSALNMWQTIAMFVVTAGISLNNGAKIFLAALVTRRKRFFEWKYLLLAVLLPITVMWYAARWEYRLFVLPKEKARNEIKKRNNDIIAARIRLKVADTITLKDSASIEIATQKIVKQRAEEKKKSREKSLQRKNGRPLADGEFMHWTDASTPRWESGVENLFGEAIQLHRDYLLEDVLKKRPVIVNYYHSSSFSCMFLTCMNYVVEAIIVLLFVFGIWIGRRKLFLWTALSFFLMDMLLHMGLGFGLNEIYIMSAHYLFVIPISIAYLIKEIETKAHLHTFVSILITFITLWCWAWNLTLIANYML